VYEKEDSPDPILDVSQVLPLLVSHMIQLTVYSCGQCRLIVCEKPESEAKCQVCSVQLCKADFTDKEREEYNYLRDNNIRKQVKQVYNRPRSSFEDDAEFYKYQDYVEAIIQDWIEGKNVDKIKRELRDYDNRHNIEIGQF
jgi:hypothetical protein